MKTLRIWVAHSAAVQHTPAMMVSGALGMKAKARVVVRTVLGIFMATITKVTADSVYVELDNGRKLKYPANSPRVLGAGVRRKRKTAIPDDELSKWRDLEEEEEKRGRGRPRKNPVARPPNMILDDDLE